MYHTLSRKGIPVLCFFSCVTKACNKDIFLLTRYLLTRYPDGNQIKSKLHVPMNFFVGVYDLNLCTWYTGKTKTRTFKNSEDSDEIPNNA